MTTDIRETLHNLGDALVPPVPDHPAFARRVASARRRRRAGRAAVAAAVVAAVGTTGWLLAPREHGRPDVATDPRHASVAPTSPSAVPLALHGRLFVSTPDDSTRVMDTRIQVEEIVAAVPDGVVYVDRESHLRRVDLHVDGTVGDPVDLVGPDPVTWAGVDAGGTTLWYADLDGVLHRSDLASGRELSATPLPDPGTVMAVGADRWVGTGVDSLQLHVGDRTYEVQPAFPPTAAALGGRVLAVTTLDGTETFSAVDGTPVRGSLGGSAAALSPDGRWTASGPDESDLDDGMSRGLWLVDNATGDMLDVPGAEVTGAVSDVWWSDPDRYFVASTSVEGTTLQECTVPDGCHTRLVEASGTLALPRD